MMKNKKALKEISLEHKKFLRANTKHKIKILSIQIGIFLGVIGLWELLTRTGVMDVFFLSSPSGIYNTTIDLYRSGELFKHIGITLYETILSFIIATSIGTIIAILLWFSKTLRRVLEPYLVILNSLPKIALGPLIIIWFGIGTKAIVVMGVLIVVIITILSMLNAFLSVDKEKILLMKSMGANSFQILFKLVIPSSFGSFISVLKINVGLSWIGTIMGEYLVSKAGLGYLIVYGGSVFKIDLVMSSTIILCILAGFMYGIIAFVEKRIKRR